MIKIFKILFLLIIPGLAFSQYKTDTNPVNISSALRSPVTAGKAAVGILGLDPSRLDISQSYQMSYLSMGNEGYSQAMYLNTMTYHFKIPLAMSFQWGIAHQPFAGTNENPLMQNGPFVSGASVEYRPTKNMLLQIEISQNPYSYGNSWYSMNRYGQWQ